MINMSWAPLTFTLGSICTQNWRTHPHLSGSIIASHVDSASSQHALLPFLSPKPAAFKHAHVILSNSYLLKIDFNDFQRCCLCFTASTLSVPPYAILALLPVTTSAFSSRSSLCSDTFHGVSPGSASMDLSRWVYLLTSLPIMSQISAYLSFLKKSSLIPKLGV